jgi:hypothetical protein
MQYEACSMCIMAEVRHAELQSEVEHYVSGRREVSLYPTMSELLITSAQRLVRALSRVRTPRECGHFGFWKRPRELLGPWGTPSGSEGSVSVR